MTPRDQYGEGVVVVGLDISSVRLDACLLVPGQPPVLRHEVLGKSSEPLIERLRRVPTAVEAFTWKRWRVTPDWLVIEDSYGAFRNAVRALDKITGAIIASCPQETQVALVSTGDWRKALGGKNTKAEGHECVLAELWNNAWFDVPDPLDEHELDAIGIALGWQRILEAQAAA